MISHVHLKVSILDFLIKVVQKIFQTRLLQLLKCISIVLMKCILSDKPEIWPEEPETGVVSGDVHSLCRHHGVRNGGPLQAHRRACFRGIYL